MILEKDGKGKLVFALPAILLAALFLLFFPSCHSVDSNSDPHYGELSFWESESGISGSLRIEPGKYVRPEGDFGIIAVTEEKLVFFEAARFQNDSCLKSRYAFDGKAFRFVSSIQPEKETLLAEGRDSSTDEILHMDSESADILLMLTYAIYGVEEMEKNMPLAFLIGGGAHAFANLSPGVRVRFTHEQARGKYGVESLR